MIRDAPSRSEFSTTARPIGATATVDAIAFVSTNAYTRLIEFGAFDWDSGNWPKCGKHGVSQEEIEQVMLGQPAVMAGPHPDEPRLRAIGKTAAGRYVFLVLMYREIDYYERQGSTHAVATER